MIDLSVYEKLPESFYLNPDVVEVAKLLLGRYLITNIDGKLTAGKIVETEAYNGREDKACHAFLKRTKRTETMYQKGGHAYIYLCYGIHHLFNVVTNEEGLADAVLIRALEPVSGVDAMQARRGKQIAFSNLTSGSGKLSQALGLHKNYNQSHLLGNQIWIATGPEEFFELETDRRVGVDYAEEDALLPWRFFIRGNPFVSVPKRNP